MVNHFVLKIVIVAFVCFITGALITAIIFRKRAKGSGKYMLRRVLLAYLIGLLLFLGTVTIYLLNYQHPGKQTKEALNGSSLVSVEKTDLGYFLDGPGKDTAFVFYPGEKIACECYVPFLQSVAEGGADVFLLKMPLNLAFLDTNAADKAIEAGAYDNWYIGGHSLGGEAAALYAASSPETVKGVVLVASYPSTQIPEEQKLLSIYGTSDAILDFDEYQSSKSLWPDQSSEYIVSGGNHTGFADCDLLHGDVEGGISPEKQQHLASKTILAFLHPVLASTEPDTEVETPEPIPVEETEQGQENANVQLFANRINDNSSLWDSGRDYEFPEGETEIYTAKGHYNQMRVLSLASQEHSDTVVFYIHGGAYLSDFDNGYYYPAVKQITLKTGYEVIVPQYPLLTGFNFTHAYTLLQSLYYRVVAEYGADHVIVMGDSAGGALAAGLCMQVAENGWEQPSQLVLSSPWVDLMITHPETDKYQELDKDLDAYMLRLYGELWAAGENPSDYHLSPMYGDVTVLRNVTLCYGDSELFTPMLQLFYEKLANKGVSCEQIIGEGMGHNFVITETDSLDDLCARMVNKQNELTSQQTEEQ
ncbi:MAG: alpha/beta hydrolase fold domain-containing protein [Oscillospiraceae bacterium]|nr:alpha/beta hydrolase fold domain-containing protein [Oscillospiraceae bacterium]